VQANEGGDHVTPAVSMIVTSYNYGRYLPEALDSLLSQSLRDLEAIVIDDASTDDTAEVLKRYSADPRVRIIIHRVNSGNIASYNEGLALARGRYVGILSADDFLISPDALERQVRVFESDPRIGMVYSAHRVLQDGVIVKTVSPWPQDQIQDGLVEFSALMWGNYILHSGTLLSADLARELGPYDQRLRHTGDWDMWMRACARRDVGYIAQPLYAYRLHASNMFHSSITPAEQTAQVVTTIERAFASLPGHAMNRLISRRRSVLRHGYVQTSWFDLYNGRRRRAAAGFAHAVARRPDILVHAEAWRFLARYGVLMAIGRDRYRRLQRWRDEGRGPAPEATG
jgi:glycosyltransferase involved in cell wall biosynthesis